MFITTARVGRPAPDAHIVSLSGESKNLVKDYIKRMPRGMPLVLNIGSYSWPPWACGVDKLLELHRTYCQEGPNKSAQLLTIYIEEAHASDEWFLPEAPDVKSGGAIIQVHRELEDRIHAAQTFVNYKKFVPEIVVDSMRNEVVDRYYAWPERLYVIVDGVVLYKGGMGPNDYHIEEVTEWLSAWCDIKRDSNRCGDHTTVTNEYSDKTAGMCKSW